MVISKSNGAKNSTDPIRRSIVLIASEQKLLMMRPYQVYAVKHIVTCIHEDSGNGIIWHTTGSGKTLTSFQGLYPRHSARHATAEDAKRGVERHRNELNKMPDEIAYTLAPQVETSPEPKDLRVELEADLKSEFAANLTAAGTLPKVACDSLVALLGASAPISADVIAAIGLEDPTQPEVPNE